MIKSYKLNVSIIFLLIVMLHICCIHRQKSKVTHMLKEESATAKSFNGVAKLNILAKGKKISAKMNYCFDSDKQYYVNDIRGAMNTSLGYLAITKEEIFLYLSKENSYLRIKSNEDNFERISGIKLTPLTFIKLFTGTFKWTEKEKKYELTKGDNIFRYYEIKDQWIVAQIYIKKQLLKALHFYNNDKRYAIINLLYNNKTKEPTEINVLIDEANLKINIKIEKQNIINQVRCKNIDLLAFMNGQQIKIDEYSSYNPLLLNLTE